MKKLFGVLFTASLLFVVEFGQTEDISSPRNPQAQDLFRPWIKREDIAATVGGVPIDVYQDPRYPSDIMVDEGKHCWLVSLEEKLVFSPGCGMFSKTDSGVKLADDFLRYADSETSHVPGVPWHDVTMDCSGVFTLLFRRPKFRENSVTFWGCDKWVEITIKR